jgi:hypothetical protein
MDKRVYRSSWIESQLVQRIMLNTYSSYILSMLKIVIFLIIFYRVFFTSEKYIAYRVKYLITGILLRGKCLLAVEVRPIQSNLCFFLLKMRKHVSLNGLTLCLNRTLWGQFLGKYSLPKNVPLFWVPLTAH